MHKARAAAALAALIVMSAAAHAQVPPDIAARVRQVGPVIDRSLDPYYAPQFGPEAWAGVTIERDLAYGPDPLHRLDVFRPEAGGSTLPVLLFVHGGAFIAGDKHGAFYPDNFTLWAAKHGMVGVNINYRLAPGHPFPAGAEDLAAALAWVRDNISRFGGDPGRIVLVGHSAGGNHIADYLGHPDLQAPDIEAVRGAVLISPFYAKRPPKGEPHAYYRAGPRTGTRRDATGRLAESRVPLFFAYAEYDPADQMRYARYALAKLCRTEDRCPRSVYLRDHNHLTEGMSVGTADRSLTGPLLEWIEGLW